MDAKNNLHILIIGGGLSGLTMAYLAVQKGLTVTVLEATDRLGGRMHTIMGLEQTPMELGATWLSEEHPQLIQLLKTLDIGKFTQFDKGKTLFQTKSFEPAQEFEIPTSVQPSYRITGGSSVLIKALAAALPTGSIQLNRPVVNIRESTDGITASTEGGQQYQADKLFICLPPQVAAENIHFPSEMPASTMDLLAEVQTWMAGAVKFTIEYKRPFWRNNGYSGMLYSHCGVITEMYDHSNFEADRFALTGFLNGGVQHYSYNTRKEYVLKQLTDLFGKEADSPLSYQDKIWNASTVLAGQQYFSQTHYNNGHPALRKAYCNGKLYFAGSETSPNSPGYMEGAVVAAHIAAQNL